MNKKQILGGILMFGLAASAWACGGENSGKHIGSVVSVDKAGKVFTIRDMEKRSAITFQANDDIISAVSGRSGPVMVNYEETEDGSLRAVGVTF